MTYTKDLSLVELARFYAKYYAQECLDELEKRDKLNTMTYDERMEAIIEQDDDQIVFDFDKNLASATKVTNNSVDDKKWNEAYEEGRKVGFRQGLKEVYRGENNEIS
jgi:hypothetical protein